MGKNETWSQSCSFWHNNVLGFSFFFFQRKLWPGYVTYPLTYDQTNKTNQHCDEVKKLPSYACQRNYFNGLHFEIWSQLKKNKCKSHIVMPFWFEHQSNNYCMMAETHSALKRVAQRKTLNKQEINKMIQDGKWIKLGTLTLQCFWSRSIVNFH